MFRVTLGKASLLATAAAAGYFTLNPSKVEADEGLIPPKYPWNHRFPWSSFDHASIRRGYQVYSQVCSTCHSLDRIAYRNLVDTCFTEEEVKEMAAERDFLDGPNEEGEMYERPGKLTDYMPRPYANEEAARFANNGAYPPDLSLITKARPNGENYLFSILTGYRETPHGLNIREGLYYNPYFPGGAIAMPQFEDGTFGSISQMSKDVTTFLSWAAEPEHDQRKKMWIKAMIVTSLIAFPLYYWKRFKWSAVKTRVVAFTKEGMGRQ